MRNESVKYVLNNPGERKEVGGGEREAQNRCSLLFLKRAVFEGF